MVRCVKIPHSSAGVQTSLVGGPLPLFPLGHLQILTMPPLQKVKQFLHPANRVKDAQDTWAIDLTTSVGRAFPLY